MRWYITTWKGIGLSIDFERMLKSMGAIEAFSTTCTLIFFFLRSNLEINIWNKCYVYSF
jgi:hypothetical protein